MEAESALVDAINDPRCDIDEEPPHQSSNHSSNTKVTSRGVEMANIGKRLQKKHWCFFGGKIKWNNYEEPGPCRSAGAF